MESALVSHFTAEQAALPGIRLGRSASPWLRPVTAVGSVRLGQAPTARMLDCGAPSLLGGGCLSLSAGTSLLEAFPAGGAATLRV